MWSQLLRSSDPPVTCSHAPYCAEPNPPPPSRHQFRHQFAADIGETVVAAFEAVGEAFVVDADEMKDGRMEVVDVHRIADDVVAELIRLTEHDARLNAAARHPDREAARMMITTEVVLLNLAL
jgi:hypothetical protein